MTLSQFSDLLDSSGLPTSYDLVPEQEETPTPFVVYRETNTDNMFADGVVYAVVHHCEVELYTNKKDLEAEAKVVEALGELYRNMVSEDKYDDGLTVITYEVDFIE